MAQDYTFQTFPNEEIAGVNNSGEIAGTAVADNETGFTNTNGSTSSIVFPGADDTSVRSINDSGQLVGQYDAANGTQDRGFLYDNGTYTPINFANSAYTEANGINNAGTIVGVFGDANNVEHGFIDTSGTLVQFDVPGATSTEINSISTEGDLAGNYIDANNVQHGFVDKDGVISTVDYPGAISTSVNGINDQGVYVGGYDNTHGFVDDNGTFSTLDGPGTGTGSLEGVNNLGQISGSQISNGQIVGFVATPDCFVSGTLIATRSGSAPVETLAPGDFVVTASRELRPVRWLGHRTVDCRNHPRPQEVLPIQIAAHAFGDNRPTRDLFVSPGHAICVDVLGEVLIPAGVLVNGSTVRQVEVDEVTYWHVELDSHDVILAENLPAESYLDMGNRGFFTETDVVDLAAGPDIGSSQRTHADFCRPYVNDGPIVDAVRARLQGRAEAAGWSLTCEIDLHLEVDGVRVDPVVRDLVARFHVPAAARDVWLVSPTARPCDTMGHPDGRDLGLTVSALRIEDGLSIPREVEMSDPRLCIGFHALEDGCRRWTAGRARLPCALWEGCEHGFYMRVELAGRPIPRWVAPVTAAAFPTQVKAA